MKILLVIILMTIAMTILTGLNMWQIKNIDTGGRLINKDLLLYLALAGLFILIFINPIIALTFRYGFSVFGKVWAPQLIYQAAPLIGTFFIILIMFKEVPSKGTLAGLIFAIASILCVVFWK